MTNERENPHVVGISRIPGAGTTAEEIVDDPEAAAAGGLIEVVSGGAFTLPEHEDMAMMAGFDVA